MCRIVYLLIILIFIQVKANNDEQNQYGGEKFPLKYLTVKKDLNESDLNHFIRSLNQVFGYFNGDPNGTEINIAMASFLAKSILKRTIRDYSNKINKHQRDGIRKLINMGENLISHYMYNFLSYDWGDLEYRVTRIFEQDDSQVYTIGDFNRNRLHKWIITSENNVNTYLKQMDEATLPRDEYCELSNNFDDFHIDVTSSDFCLSKVASTKESIDFSQMQNCALNEYCATRIFALPSVAYTLSHRFLNLFLRHSVRRCYIRSEEEDMLHMEKMCANMFRETVYLARRGFFARDLFLEHICLCGLLGYEEFHKKDWYYKALSWIQKDGCISENMNFRLNNTIKRISVRKNEKDVRKRRKYNEYYCRATSTECNDHPTAVLLTFLATGIRYAAYVL